MRNSVCRLCQKDCTEDCLLFLLDRSGTILKRGRVMEFSFCNDESFKGKKIWELEGYFADGLEEWQKAMDKLKLDGSLFLDGSFSCGQTGLALKQGECGDLSEKNGDFVQLINVRIFNFCCQSQLVNTCENLAKSLKATHEKDIALKILLDGMLFCDFQKVFVLQHGSRKFSEYTAEKSLNEIGKAVVLNERIRSLVAEQGSEDLFRIDSSILKHFVECRSDSFRYYLLPINHGLPHSISLFLGFPPRCHEMIIAGKIKKYCSLLRESYLEFFTRTGYVKKEGSLQSRLERSLQEGRIATWNWNPRTGEFSDLGNFEQLLGYTQEELLQHHYDGAELIPEDDRKSLMRSLNEHLLGDIPYFSADFRMRHRKGHYVWFHAQGKVVERDRQMQAISMLGTIQDISEKVEMDSQLRQSQKMEAIGSLASGIAHDFNNLLQVILGYTEILKEKCFEATIETDDADQIIEAGEKAMMLVRQLLSFSRIQEQQLVSINLSEILPMMVKMLRAFVGEQIDLVTNLKAADLKILGDPVQLEQLLMNLCINARDAMPGGGKVIINAEPVMLEDDIVTILGRIPTGNYVVISVTDHGCGIDPSVQDRIFEPFFTTREVGRGTGLGLAMVYSIVKRHGAFLRLVSEKGVGTTFYIYFAMCEAEPALAEKAIAATPPEPALMPEVKLAGTETILLAEDDLMVRKLAERTLSQAGYTVISVENGLQALETFAKDPQKIDLLLLDMIMPEMTGRDAYDKMRELRSPLPVLFASGFSSDLFEAGYLQRINGKLLEKPYQKHSLLKMVRSQLDGS